MLTKDCDQHHTQYFLPSWNGHAAFGSHVARNGHPIKKRLCHQNKWQKPENREILKKKRKRKYKNKTRNTDINSFSYFYKEQYSQHRIYYCQMNVLQLDIKCCGIKAQFIVTSYIKPTCKLDNDNIKDKNKLSPLDIFSSRKIKKLHLEKYFIENYNLRD